jgi:hypothetical protein
LFACSSRKTDIPESPPTSWISWVQSLWALTEMEILEYVGLDAYMLLRMFRMGIIYFTISGIYGRLRYVT